MKRGRSTSLLRNAGLALLMLLVAALVTTVESTAAAAACTLEETEAVVALMGVVLMNRNCLGVADNKCPVDTKCLSVLEHMVRKIPDCTAAANFGTSQRARLQKLLDKCGPATPAPTTPTTPKPTSAWTATTDATAAAAKAAAAAAAASQSDHTDSSLFIDETSTRSVASSPSSRIAGTCTAGIAICAVAAANW